MTYPTRRELYGMVLDHLFGLATQKPIQEARRCGPQRASQIVGEVVHLATGHRSRHRGNPAVIAFLLAQKEQCWPQEGTPEWFFYQNGATDDH